MPRIIEAATEECFGLEDLVDRLEAGGFDARDEDSFASWGEDLKKLANNRHFLSDIVISELKDRCKRQLGTNQYSAPVILLHNSTAKYIIRANVWPSAGESILRQSGPDPFFYGLPHDHNFSFLTVGYFGPGYWSDYYEYDYEKVAGFPGEEVDLRFIERSRLEIGKVMLYRAHRDVHLQLPADELSVSLNIVETSHCASFCDQYAFDLQNSKIDRILNRISLEPLLALAAHYGGEDGDDLLSEFSANHPNDRFRWRALRARAGKAATIDDRIALLDRAAGSSSLLVSGMARREIARLEASRGWIEDVPPIEARQSAA